MGRVADLTEHMRGQQQRSELLACFWLAAKYAGHPQGGSLAIREAEERFTRNVVQATKAAVAISDGATAGSGAELQPFLGLTQAWLTDLARTTLLGRLDCVRAPFDTSFIAETTAFSASFVEPGQPIPATKAIFSAPSRLGAKKVAALVGVSDEMTQLWTPATRDNLQESVARAVRYARDFSLLNPNLSATAARPQSLTNGIAPGQSTGSTAAQLANDLKAMLQSLIDGGSDLSRVIIAMAPSTALHASQLLTTGGAYAFPDLGAAGGAIWRVPAYVTTAASVPAGSPTSNIVAAIDAAKVMLADDQELDFAASRVTSIALDDAPTAPSNLVSAFQTATTVLRLSMRINWRRASDSAVAWFSTAF